MCGWFYPYMWMYVSRCICVFVHLHVYNSIFTHGLVVRGACLHESIACLHESICISRCSTYIYNCMYEDTYVRVYVRLHMYISIYTNRLVVPGSCAGESKGGMSDVAGVTWLIRQGVMSHVAVSCTKSLIHTSHVAHMNASRFTYDVGESKWVMSRMNECPVSWISHVSCSVNA